MEQILVVFTGGTISCQANVAVMGATAEVPEGLLRRYREERADEVEFVTAAPLTLLSENLLPRDWGVIAACVRQRLTPDMAGVVITHGTDTLGYSAPALSFLLAGIKVPVALVSANFPPEDPRSNGPANFLAAVDFIRHEGYPGVFVFFRQRGQDQVFLASRLLQAAPVTDSFASVTGDAWGWMEKGRLRLRSGPEDPTPEALRAHAAEPVFTRALPPLRPCVAYVRPFPGLDYRSLTLPPAVRAVFHGLYHSGTACVRQEEGEEETGLLSFARRCGEQGGPVYVAPLWRESAVYASYARMQSSGIRVLPPMAEEAAYAKLVLAYNLYPEEEAARAAFLAQNLAFEHIGEPRRI